MKQILIISLRIAIVLGILLALTDTKVSADPLSFDCSTVSEIPQTECEALVALFNNTDGTNWIDNTNWLLTSTPSDWYGVGVDNATVFYLALNSNMLKGELPNELENLASLQTLDLSENRLSGEIPVGLGNLTDIKVLNLSFNKLDGFIPIELKSLINLKWLVLEYNQLSGEIPGELSQLTNLEWLSLGGNFLTGTIPVEIGHLINLKILLLDFNQLSGEIPIELGQLINLERLWLGKNNLYGEIPAELGYMTNLQELELQGNLLRGEVPGELENLTKLNYLALDYNYLNIPTDYPDPINSFHQFLHSNNPGWHILQGFHQIINGSIGGSLMSLDSNTRVAVPANAVTGVVSFTFGPRYIPRNPRIGFFNAWNSFQLSAEDSFGHPITTLSQPVEITIHYSDDQVKNFSEDWLGLFYWDKDKGEWVDAATTCSPTSTYYREPETNTISVSICHLSEFSLMGKKPLYYTFLPQVAK